MTLVEWFLAGLLLGIGGGIGGFTSVIFICWVWDKLCLKEKK